jgi:hypothetical protein
MSDAIATFTEDIDTIKLITESIFGELSALLKDARKAVIEKDYVRLEALLSDADPRLLDLPKDANQLYTKLFESLRAIPNPPKNFFNQLKWARNLGDPLSGWRNNYAHPFVSKWLKR